jgi:hypothetical protein
MPAIGRNQPCPCGSGKKHKQCCLGKPAPAARRKRLWLPSLLALFGIGLGAYVGTTRGLVLGLSFGAGALIIAGVVALFYDPPPPSADGTDPAAINFGGR